MSDYFARRPEMDEQLAVLARFEQPINDHLETVGLVGISLSDLAYHDQSPQVYELAVPILLSHFKKEYPGITKDQILIVLGKTPYGAAGIDMLIDEYRKMPNGQETPGWRSGGMEGFLAGDVKFKCAGVIAIHGKKTHLQEIIDLSRNPIHGFSRILFLKALRRSKRPEVIELFTDLADDNFLAGAICDWKTQDEKRQMRAKRAVR